MTNFTSNMIPELANDEETHNKIRVLTANGWRAHWHPNNWVKQSAMVSDFDGVSLDKAYQQHLDEVKYKEEYEEFRSIWDK